MQILVCCCSCSGRIVNEKDQLIAQASRRQEEQARRIHVLEAELARHGLQNSVIGTTALSQQASPAQLKQQQQQQQQQQQPPPPLPATPASPASLDSGRLSKVTPSASWSPTAVATPPPTAYTGVGSGGGRAEISSLAIESPFFSAQKAGASPAMGQ